mmetsp:Transcript_14504/g.31162  ORF Transcript_14504/g.31162 Transcript_14504/m.31162 type:complete len:165 (+) Transcript_14504:3-497(+)
MFDEVLNIEEDLIRAGRKDGLAAARRRSACSAYREGFSNGEQLATEIAFYQGCYEAWRQLLRQCAAWGGESWFSANSEWIRKSYRRLDALQAALDAVDLPSTRSDHTLAHGRALSDENLDLEALMENVRTRFKHASALLSGSTIRFSGIDQRANSSNPLAPLTD